jgi:predicted transposase/invertase (TIGR01784 family)
MKNKQNPLSPLADPVVAAIFDSVEHAREAAKSLVGCILAEDGIIVDDIIDIIPQKINAPFADMKTTRVDVFIETDKKERILVEVQMYKEPLLERNLLAISHDIVSSVNKGTTVWKLRADFPTIYVINIMNYSGRTDSDEFFQPIKLMYTKPPMREAFEKLKIYNIELPKFRGAKQDLSKKLDAWLYILDTANLQNKSVEEVVKMNETARETLLKDPGFLEFKKNYEHAVADDDVRREYNSYINGLFYVSGILRSAFEDGTEKGEKKGLQQGKLETARNMLRKNYSLTDIAELTGLPISEIENL